MNSVLHWGIDFIAVLQTSAPWLVAPSRLLSFLGTEEFYLLLLPFLYWYVDPCLGLRIGIILSVSNNLNTFFKFAFHQPRPYWMSEKVRALSAESSYGLPSGHAQHGVAVWGTVAAWIKGRAYWLLSILILLIGLSRIVLAVHFPTDVLVGWVIGGAILWAFLKWEAPVIAWFNRFAVAQKIVLVFIASMLLLLLPLAGLVFVPPAGPSQWEMTASQALSLAPGARAIHPYGTAGAVGVAGIFFGLVTGALLSFRQGGFDARGTWRRRTVRFVLGMIGVAILWLGLRWIFPRDVSLASQVLRYVRYGLVGLWVTYGAPWLFIKLGMCTKAER